MIDFTVFKCKTINNKTHSTFRDRHFHKSQEDSNEIEASPHPPLSSSHSGSIDDMLMRISYMILNFLFQFFSVNHFTQSTEPRGEEVHLNTFLFAKTKKPFQKLNFI